MLINIGGVKVPTMVSEAETNRIYTMLLLARQRTRLWGKLILKVKRSGHSRFGKSGLTESIGI